MATLDDVRRIALSLPETGEREGRFAFFVTNKDKQKEFAWSWSERVGPKKPRVENLEVLAIRIPGGESQKDAMIGALPERYFTEPHYNGYPAILVRLANIGVDEIRELLMDGWRCQAPKAMAKEYDAARPR